MYHVGCVPLLHRLSVDVEVEMQVGHWGKLSLVHKRSDGSRVVKSLAYVPGQTFLAQLLLQVACGEVYAHGQLIIVTVCEPFGYASSHMVDAHHHLGLVVETLCEVGNEERQVWPYHSSLGFREDDRLLY